MKFLAEARDYAARLAEILPSSESLLRVAKILSASGDHEGALRLIGRVEAEGYSTRVMYLIKSQLLMSLGRAKQAAQELEIALTRYPQDYELVFNCGMAWTKALEYDRAIPLWESLLGRSEAKPSLALQLAQLYLLKAATDSKSGDRAFELLKRVFKESPNEPSLPALLVAAAQTTGRGREAWSLISALDLRDNPYLRPMSIEEAAPMIKSLDERLRSGTNLYEAGAIPFSTFAKLVPRPAWYYWWSRLALWRESSGGRMSGLRPLLVNLPSIRRTLGSISSPPSGLLLDATAILTIGCLGITQEIFGALRSANCPVTLFPGASEWLREEATKLQADQMPWYRGRYLHLQTLLQSRRGTVEIRNVPTSGEPSADESARKKLGPVAYDLEEALRSQGYYLDDYIDGDLIDPQIADVLIRSSELLASFASSGLVLSSEVAKIEAENPKPFSEFPKRARMLDKPVVMSEHSLLDWLESGLLEKWLDQKGAWPKVVVGPYAWSSLQSNATEASFYRESLRAATTTRDTIDTLLKEGSIEEARRFDPAEAQKVAPSGLHEAWLPSVELLLLAARSGLAVWADDLFAHLLVDRRGLLPADPEFRVAESQVRTQAESVQVLDTEQVLVLLKSQKAISDEREGEIDWLLFLHGYRVLTLRGALRWLLSAVPFQPDSMADPYRRILNDLNLADNWIPATVPEPRRSLFVRTTLVSIVPALISEVWKSHMPEELKRKLSELLLSTSEHNLGPQESAQT